LPSDDGSAVESVELVELEFGVVRGGSRVRGSRLATGALSITADRPKPVTDNPARIVRDRGPICNVTSPVVLVVSAVEVHTLERAVYCAATFAGGCGG